MVIVTTANLVDTQVHAYNGGIVTWYLYDNGYGLSVAEHAYAYGGREAAVLHTNNFHADATYSLCYATPITNDVIGWLSACDVEELKKAVAALPKNERCDHEHAPLDERIADPFPMHEAGK